MIKYVHCKYLKAAAATWKETLSIPAISDWYSMTGGDAFLRVHLSNIGGNLQDPRMRKFNTQPAVGVDPNAVKQQDLELRVHGIQVYGVVTNQSSLPVRVEMRLVYVPNLNAFTVSPNAYLLPQPEMFYKSGKGTGNLLRQGYDRRSITMHTATGIPTSWTQLGRKVIYLKPGQIDASLSGSTTAMKLKNIVYRRFSLSHYFKTPKKAFARNNQTYLTTGNYYLCLWCDAASITDIVPVLATSNFQYSYKAPIHNDVPQP